MPDGFISISVPAHAVPQAVLQRAFAFNGIGIRLCDMDR